MMYKLSEFAKLIGVHPVTVRRWIYEGKINPFKTKTGRYYFTDEHLKQFINDSNNNESQYNNIHKNRAIIYCRVSTQKQKDNLKNQIDTCKNFAISRGFNIIDIITDIGSSFNFNKKGLKKLIDKSFNKEFDVLIIYSKDRLTRIAFDLFKLFFDKLNIEIEIIDNSDKIHDDNQLKDITEELISFIHYITSKIYGSRSYKKRKIEKCINGVLKDEKEK